MNKSLYQYLYIFTGQASVSTFHFVLGLWLVRELSTSDFGIYAIILILAYFLMAVGNALTAIPMSVNLPRTNSSEESNQTIRLLDSINYLYCISTIVFVTLIIGFYFTTIEGGLAAGIYAASLINRNHSNSKAYSKFNPNGVFISNLKYSIFSLIIYSLWYYYKVEGWDSFISPIISMSIGNILAQEKKSLVSFKYNKYFSFTDISILSYKDTWKNSSQWSIISVILSEFVGSFHNYLSIITVGSHGFAPYAAAMIFYKPLNIVIATLSNLERPKIAKLVHSNSYKTINNLRIRVMLSLFVVWIFSLIIILFNWSYIYNFIFLPQNYNESIIFSAMIVWSIVYLVRALRMFIIIELQSFKLFKIITTSGYYGAFCTVFVTLVLYQIGGLGLSLWGLVAGEITLLGICTYYLFVNYKRNIMSS